LAKVKAEILCDAASVTTIDQLAGVIVQKVMLRGRWGSNEATVYLPDRKVADGAVVFSDSAIHSKTGNSVNLLSLAFTLAHAGAAVVVPRRILTCPPTDRSANVEGAVVIWAEYWLVDHTKLFHNGEPTVNQQNMVVYEGFAYVGPRLCDPAIASECKLTDPLLSEDCVFKYYCRHHIWVPIGETEGGDSTPSFITNGGLGAVDFIHKELGLAPIKALMAAPTPSSRNIAC